MIKYLLCPGYVTSRNDGDRHYVGPRNLAMLYGVRIDECVVADTPQAKRHSNLIQLAPRFDGNYSLNDAIKYSTQTVDKRATLRDRKD